VDALYAGATMLMLLCSWGDVAEYFRLLSNMRAIDIPGTWKTLKRSGFRLNICLRMVRLYLLHVGS
jgi:hypothetical protein